MSVRHQGVSACALPMEAIQGPSDFSINEQLQGGARWCDPAVGTDKRMAGWPAQDRLQVLLPYKGPAGR